MLDHGGSCLWMRCFWRRVICFSPDTSHCLLSCCVYTLLLSRGTNSQVLLCLPSQPPHVTSAAFRPFCLEIKAPRVRVCGRGSPGEARPLALSPTTQVSPDLSATGWLCLQPERRPRARFLRSRCVIRDWKVLLCVLGGRTKHGERSALTTPHFCRRHPGLSSNTASAAAD